MYLLAQYILLLFVIQRVKNHKYSIQNWNRAKKNLNKNFMLIYFRG